MRDRGLPGAAGRAYGVLRRAGLAWLAVELGAATLAIAIVLAVLPLIVTVIAYTRGDVWALLLVVGSLSVPLAAMLSRPALRLAREVGASALRR